MLPSHACGQPAPNPLLAAALRYAERGWRVFPLLEILDLPNFVIGWSNRSSTGKTTVLRLAASVWGNPDERSREGSILFSWNLTKVWLGYAAGTLVSLPLIVDETRLAPKPEDVERVLYMIAEGIDKGRGQPRGIRRTGHWSTVLMSTGEAKITSFSQADGVRNRCVCIRGKPFGEKSEATRDVIYAVTDGVKAHYGHAGPRFVSWLGQQRNRWPEFQARHRALRDRFILRPEDLPSSEGDLPICDLGGLGEEGTPAVQTESYRLADYVAVIELAAELVHEAGILPWDFAGAISAELWEEILSEVTGGDLAKRALEDVLSYAGAHADSFFGRHRRDRKDDPIPPLKGWTGRWCDDDPGEIAFFPTQLRAILTEMGYRPEEVLSAWAENGWTLPPDASGRLPRCYVDGAQYRLIVLSRPSFDPTDEW